MVVAVVLAAMMLVQAAQAAAELVLRKLLMEQMAQPILAVAVVAERLITLAAFTQVVLVEPEL
jgi:hypothetical protein